MNGITAAEARAMLDAEHEAERNAEAACRLDFRVYGDGDGEGVLGHPVQAVRHAERCVCSPKCSLTYDPIPYPEAEPVDVRLYEGTSIAALYRAGAESDLADLLGGWTLTPRSDRYE